MDVLDVVPRLQDRDTVMELLKSTPKPFRPHYSRQADWTRGYSPTFSDVEELLSAKRPDLADYILETTPDVNVLYEASRAKLTVTSLKAVCRNNSTPLDLLVFLYCDSRKSLSQAAQSALAGRLRVFVNRSHDFMGILVEAVSCPEENLPKVLLEAKKSWPGSAMDVLLAAVFDRPEPMSKETWSYLARWDWRWLAMFSPGHSIASMARHPLATVEKLEDLLPHTMHRASRKHVLRGLVDKLPVGSERWIEVVLELAASRWNSVDELAQGVTPELAATLLKSGRSYAPGVALASGHLSDQDIRSWVSAWLNKPDEIHYAAAFLEHPAVDSDLLASCMKVAQQNLGLRAAISRNPSLTEKQQVAMAGSVSHAATALAQNPSLTLAGAKAVIQHVCETPEPFSGGHSIPWMAQAPVLSILGNPSVPAEFRMSAPASILQVRRHELKQTTDALVASLDEKFGADADKWRSFLDLLPEWEGTVGDLVNAVETL